MDPHRLEPKTPAQIVLISPGRAQEQRQEPGLPWQDRVHFVRVSCVDLYRARGKTGGKCIVICWQLRALKSQKPNYEAKMRWSGSSASNYTPCHHSPGSTCKRTSGVWGIVFEAFDTLYGTKVWLRAAHPEVCSRGTAPCRPQKAHMIHAHCTHSRCEASGSWVFVVRDFRNYFHAGMWKE